MSTQPSFSPRRGHSPNRSWLLKRKGKGKRTRRRQASGLGETLRSIRKKSGVSIKSAAPELGVNYTYLSKIENGYVTPSSQFLGRLADFFKIDGDRLYVAAEKLPPDVEQILKKNLSEAVALLRRRFKHDGPAT